MSASICSWRAVSTSPARRRRRSSRTGACTVAGRREKASYKAEPGEEIVVEIPASAEARRSAGENIPLAVVFEDDEVLVVDKAAGMVVHPAPGNWTGTLVNALKGRGQALAAAAGGEREGIVHRLDKDTSGLLLVAKTDRAHTALGKAIAQRRDRAALCRAGWGHLETDRLTRGPSDRARSARPKAHGDRQYRKGGADGFLPTRAVRRGRSSARAPALGAHASDSRPPGVDRPSGGGRRRVRRRRSAATAGAAAEATFPPRGLADLPASGDRGVDRSPRSAARGPRALARCGRGDGHCHSTRIRWPNLASTVSPTDISARRLVVFRLGDASYGIDLGAVREILRARPATRLPGAPKCGGGADQRARRDRDGDRSRRGAQGAHGAGGRRGDARSSTGRSWWARWWTRCWKCSARRRTRWNRRRSTCRRAARCARSARAKAAS